jgi:hypothetical protein
MWKSCPRPRPGHGVHEIQPGHVLVGHFRIHPNHLRVIQRGDEAQHRPTVGR